MKIIKLFLFKFYFIILIYSIFILSSNTSSQQTSSSLNSSLSSSPSSPSSSSSPPLTSKSSSSSSTSNSIDISLIQRFIEYHLYTNTFNSIELLNKEICLLNENENKTLNFLNSHIIYCPNFNHFPRILSTNQVSFKKSETENSNNNSNANASNNNKQNKNKNIKNMKKSKTKSKKIGSSNNSKFNLNNTIEEQILEQSNVDFNNDNDEENNSKDNNNEDDDDDEKTIHKYLVFALVLPKHPYSRELVESMHILAPMYPSVTFYFGISYDFHELSTHYAVKSFPKLLFFHNGLLVKKYSDKRDPITLAGHLSKWIGKYPQTIPIRQYRSTYNHNNKIKNYNYHYHNNILKKKGSLQSIAVYNYNSTWFSVPSEDDDKTYFAQLLRYIDLFLRNLSYGRTTEPLIAISPKVIQWDFEILFVTLLYTIIRGIYWLKSLISTRRTLPNIGI